MLINKNRIWKRLKQHMPAIIAGICCWIFLWIFTGTSCWLRSVFGIPCPGCGSTRAVAALYRGHIKEALEFHPLIFITLALIAVYIFTFILRLVFKKNFFDRFPKKWLNIFLWCIFGLYIGVYAIRMILLYPRIEPMTYLNTSSLGRLISLIKNIFTSNI